MARKCAPIAESIRACFFNYVDWLDEVEAEWLACAEQNQALDKERLRPLIDRFYQLAGLPAPLFLILDSPFAALVAAQLAQGLSVPGAFAARLRRQLSEAEFEGLGRVDFERHTPNPLYSLLALLRERVVARLNPEDYGALMSRMNTRLVRQFEDWSYRYQLLGQLRRDLGSPDDTHLIDWISWVDNTALIQLGERLGILSAEDCRDQIAFMRSGFWAAMQRRGLCILVNPPTAVHWEDRDSLPLGEWRLHRTDGPVLEFRDGYRLFREHGQVVDSDVLHWGREHE